MPRKKNRVYTTGKYNARKTEIDGFMFDSKKEADMYMRIKFLIEEGKIKDLELHPKFILMPGFVGIDGKKRRPITYSADFRFYDNRHKRVRIVDCKGYKTVVYRIKQKLFDNLMLDKGMMLEEEI